MTILDLESANESTPSRSCVPSGGFDAIARLEGVDVDLSGSTDSSRESGAGGREGECQLTSRILSLVDEGNIEGQEGVDVIVRGDLGDCSGVLSSESAVRLCLLDGDDQVGEQSCLGAFGGSGAGGRSRGAYVDSDSRGSVWRGRRVHSDGGDSGGWWRRRRRWCDCDGGGRGVRLLGDADVVSADNFPRVSAFAVFIRHATNWRRSRGLGGRAGRSLGDRGRDNLLSNTDVVFTDSMPRIATVAVLVSHAADRRGSWG